MTDDFKAIKNLPQAIFDDGPPEGTLTIKLNLVSGNLVTRLQTEDIDIEIGLDSEDDENLLHNDLADYAIQIVAAATGDSSDEVYQFENQLVP